MPIVNLRDAFEISRSVRQENPMHMIRRYLQPVRDLRLMFEAFDLPVQEALREEAKRELGLTPNDEEWYYDPIHDLRKDHEL